MKPIQYACIAIIVCVAVILAFGTLDWVSKHTLYIQQRSALHGAIQAGNDYEALKGTVSYLQGSATRTLNNLKSTFLYLMPLLVAAFYIYLRGK